jgi:hypothetical protein
MGPKACGKSRIGHFLKRCHGPLDESDVGLLDTRIHEVADGRLVRAYGAPGGSRTPHLPIRRRASAVCRVHSTA